MIDERKKNRSIGVDDYVGTMGHEKHAIHQTHFSGVDTTNLSASESKSEWVKVGPGKYILVNKELQ